MAYQASSDAVPHGSAGLVNQSRPSDVEQVGAVYAQMIAEATYTVPANVDADAPQPQFGIGAGTSAARPDMRPDRRPNSAVYGD